MRHRRTLGAWLAGLALIGGALAASTRGCGRGWTRLRPPRTERQARTPRSPSTDQAEPAASAQPADKAPPAASDWYSEKRELYFGIPVSVSFFPADGLCLVRAVTRLLW